MHAHSTQTSAPTRAKAQHTRLMHYAPHGETLCGYDVPDSTPIEYRDYITASKSVAMGSSMLCQDCAFAAFVAEEQRLAATTRDCAGEAGRG